VRAVKNENFAVGKTGKNLYNTFEYIISVKFFNKYRLPLILIMIGSGLKKAVSDDFVLMIRVIPEVFDFIHIWV